MRHLRGGEWSSRRGSGRAKLDGMSLQHSRPSEHRHPATLGLSLRRWRTLNRVKQSHAAELFGVGQSTVSRWENGLQIMETAERIKVETVIAANVDAAADGVLAQLVSDASRPVHLVCDYTHRLLACSAPREREFGRPISQLRGRSMFRYASDEIAMQEALLETRGWYDFPTPEPIVMHTGANRSRIVRIKPSCCRWTRLTLSTGAVVRLVETLQPLETPAIQSGRSENR